MAKEEQEGARNTRSDKKSREMRTQEVFLTILKENLLYMKHQETQRMWVANIFVAIVVGTAAYLSQSAKSLDDISLFIPVIFLIISLLCLLITLKVNYVFIKTKEASENIFDDGEISLGEQQDWRKYVLLLKSTGIWGVLRVSYLYVLLYTISISAAIFLIIRPSVSLLWSSLAASLPLLACIIHICIIRIHFLRKEQQLDHQTI